MIRHSSDSHSKLSADASILAGGRSQRMGRNKAWLELGNEPTIARLIRILSEPFESVRIITNEAHGFESLEVPVLIDEKPGSGPLGGIHTALSTTKHQATFVVGCDYPFTNSHFVRGLASLIPGHDAVVPRQDRVPVPVCAFYSTRCLPAVETSLDRRILEARTFLSQVNVRWVEDRELEQLDPSGVALFNLNTPEDYDRALTLLTKSRHL